MKVAIIHFRLLRKGGLETRLFNYIQYFLNAGDEVTVIVAKKDPSISLPDGVKIVTLPVFPFPKSARQIYFDNRLKKFFKANHFDLSLSLGRTSSQDAVIIPGNHLGYLNAMGKTPTTLSDKLQVLIDKRTFKETPVLLSCSEMMERELIELYDVDPDKIHTVYPPTNTLTHYPGLKDQQSEFRTQLGLPQHKKLFFFLSSSHRRKGLPLLLDVFSKLDPSVFELVIGGDPIPNHKLDNVKYLGYVRNSEKVYAACDFMILPALYEPYGQVVTESLYCRTPVILSNMVGAGELVNDNWGKIVEGFDTDIWCTAIKDAVDEKFSIPLDINDLMGLSVENHMQKIKNILLM